MLVILCLSLDFNSLQPGCLLTKQVKFVLEPLKEEEGVVQMKEQVQILSHVKGIFYKQILKFHIVPRWMRIHVDS